MHNEVLEELVVVKRSGQRVSFNASKVAIAIKKAFDSIGQDDEKKIFKVFERVLTYINENYKDRKTINVEDIQDIIEQSLLQEKQTDVYNSFKEYRERRSLSRKLFSEKSEHKFVKAIEKIEETSFCDNNKSASDLVDDFSKIISSEYSKSYILDNKSVKALEEGNIYINDLEYFSLGILASIHVNVTDKMLEEDFNKTFASIIKMQKEVAGEIALDNLDRLLENYFLLKFKKILIEEMEKTFKLLGFYEYLNVRKINELILKEKSIDIDTCNYSLLLLNENLLIIFTKIINYSQKAIEKIIYDELTKLLDTLEYFKEKKNKFTISFGKNTSMLGKKILESLFKLLKEKTYLNINFIIKNPLENSDDIFESLDNNIYLNFTEDKEYFASGLLTYPGEENIYSGKALICKSSINLARLGLKYQNKAINDFYDELSNLMELAKNELLLTFENIGTRSKEYYKVLFNGNVYDDEKLDDIQHIRKVIKNGTIALGIVGLKECALCIKKDESKALKFIDEVLDYLNKKIKEYQNDTHLNFVLYETSNSRALNSLLKIDKAIYGPIKFITDKEKYDILDDTFTRSYSILGDIQNKYSGGKLIKITISKSETNKKLLELIKNLKNSNISFVKL